MELSHLPDQDARTVSSDELHGMQLLYRDDSLPCPKSGITAADDSDTLLVIDTDIDKQAVERDSVFEIPKRKTTKKQKPNRHKNKRHSNPVEYDGQKMDHIHPTFNNRPGLKQSPQPLDWLLTQVPISMTVHILKL